MKKRIQIFIDHDIIVRHFLHSGAFNEIQARCEVEYVFPNDRRVKSDVSDLGLPRTRIIPADRPRAGIFTELARLEGLRRARTRRGYRFVTDLWRLMLPPQQFRSLWFWSLPGLFHVRRRYLLAQLKAETNISSALDSFRPDAVIHPSVLAGLFVNDLPAQCRIRGIPCLFLMNSWDNPSTKALAIDHPDAIWVWGQQTLEHARDFMGIEESRVHLGGAAQFEVYRQPPHWSRSDLVKRLGIDPPPDRIILYAGSSKGVDEIRWLRSLDKACHKGLFGSSLIVYRPHPWRTPSKNETDFRDISWRHVRMDPFMEKHYNSPSDADTIGRINLADYRDTHAMLSAVDVVVSNVSTILLEAAMHGAPTVCIATDEEIQSNKFLRAVYKSRYFNDLFERLPVFRCRDSAELEQKVGEALLLADDSQALSELERATDWFVVKSDVPYSIRLADFVDCMVSSSQYKN